MLVGFKRIKVQVFDKTGKPDGDPFIVEGAQGKGATQEATISGLSAEPIKVYGSDVSYYVSQKGTGDVSIAVTLFDIPDDMEAKILGYAVDTQLKAQFVGEASEPPYCALVLESKGSDGDVAVFGFFKGKFSKGDIALKTKEGGGYTPGGQPYTFSCASSDREDKSKGNTMVKFMGTEAEQKAIEALIFNKQTVEGGSTNVKSVS